MWGWNITGKLFTIAQHTSESTAGVPNKKDTVFLASLTEAHRWGFVKRDKQAAREGGTFVPWNPRDYILSYKDWEIMRNIVLTETDGA